MRKTFYVILLTLAAYAAWAENTIAVEKLSDRIYQLTLTSTEVLDPAHAQEILLPTAESLCEERHPKYGHYSFESTELIAGQPSTDKEETFVLTQDIECVSIDSGAEISTRSYLSDADERAAVESQIRALSETYFTEIFGGKYEDAYLRQSESVRSFRTFDEWTAQMDELRENAGDIGELNIHTITIYDNPPDSPEQGLYVAADFQNRFSRAPYHCGFLVWFRSVEQQFELIREESGLITNQTLLQVPKDQLPNLMAQFRCSAR